MQKALVSHFLRCLSEARFIPSFIYCHYGVVAATTPLGTLLDITATIWNTAAVHTSLCIHAETLSKEFVSYSTYDFLYSSCLR